MLRRFFPFILAALACACACAQDAAQKTVDITKTWDSKTPVYRISISGPDEAAVLATRALSTHGSFRITNADAHFGIEIAKAQNGGAKIVLSDDMPKASGGEVHTIPFCTGNTFGAFVVEQPAAQLAVGTLQNAIDALLKETEGAEVDYIHGEAVVRDLASKPDAMGFLLPAMQKSELCLQNACGAPACVQGCPNRAIVYEERGEAE